MNEHGNNAAMRKAPIAVKEGVYTGDYGNRFAVVNVNLGGYRFHIHADHTGFYPHIKVKDQKEVMNLVVDELVGCINKGAATIVNPPRNCDVGTADEQAERFENFCLKHIGCAEETGGRHCAGCPMEKASKNITQKCDRPNDYDELHAREWMERYPHGWYNSELDHGTGDEDK